MASSDCEASAPPSSTHNVLEADAEEEPSRGERTTRRRKYKKRWPGKCCNGPTSIFPAALRRAKSEDIGAAKANEEEERPQQKGKGHYSKKRRSHSSQQQENAKSGVAVIVQRCDLDSSTDDTASQHTTTTAHSQRNRLATKTGGELLMKTNGGGNNNEGTQACAKDMVVTINVSGMHFQTYESTLRRFPNSLLGDVHKRRQLWNEQLQEFFLDRSSRCFEAVLHIYRSGGQVVRPVTVPVELFIDELVFYELKDDVWNNFCESEGCRIRPPEKMPKNELQRKMEHPDTSPLARFLASFSVLVIIVSTVSFCLESLEALKPTEANREWTSPFFWIEFSCCLWFSIELLVRFLASPSKTQFMKSFLNVLDFVAVAPFFVNLMFQDEKAVRHSEPHAQTSSTSFAVLRIVRLVRVFRIFKLSRHFTGLQVLGKTFQASIQEFFLLIFFMGIALVLFSSGVYFAEQGEPNSKFTSIPASFWYVLATMTTVGYGDMVPHGVYGKIVGSCCALIGVLTLALPVPIIVANFKRFYRQEIILAKMYEQNPPPKQAHAIILHSRTEEESINTALVDGKPVLRANDLV